MHPNHVLLVKNEIDKYHKVDFIEPIEYSPCFYNIVTAIKPNREIRCYIDFRDLNKTFLKDNFPMSFIKIIIDSTTGHEILSLMDGFS